MNQPPIPTGTPFCQICHATSPNHESWCPVLTGEPQLSYQTMIGQTLQQAAGMMGQMANLGARHSAEARIEELEQCLFEGLTVTTEQELHAWFKKAEALLAKKSH